MNTDALRPGEVDLEAPAPPPSDPAPAAVVAAPPEVDPVPAADVPPADAAPAAEDLAPAPPETPRGGKRTMLEELIETRHRARQAEEQLTRAAPILQRLTPELQQAILDGRAHAAPAGPSPDARRAELIALAEQLRLPPVDDGTGRMVPDLESAERVQSVIHTTAQKAIAPLRQMALQDKALAHVQKAIDFATQHGYDVDTVRNTYVEVLQQANGPAMIADPKIAETIWYQAVGRATAMGKVPKAPRAAAAPGAPPAAGSPPPVVGDPAGRRAAGTSLVLSPTLQRVYREHNLDPNKTITATTPLDYTRPIDLE